VGTAVLRNVFQTVWFREQLMNISGVDQAMVFDTKYQLVSVGLLLLCSVVVYGFVRRTGSAKIFRSLPFQIWLVTLVGVLLVPGRIEIPGYRHALTFIASRMSLALGVCLCAMLAAFPANRTVRYGFGAAALLFFAFLYHDERILNGVEDRMEAAVRQLPPNQRVISGIEDPDLRVNAITHMIDRVCIGHCYSYSNYEPSTGQFRIQVTAPNPIVASRYVDTYRLQVGGYVVQERDAPLFQLRVNDAGALEIREVPPGTTTTATNIYPL
jgi:hypothetical protein